MRAIASALVATLCFFAFSGFAADISVPTNDQSSLYQADQGAKLFAGLPVRLQSDQDDEIDDEFPDDPPTCEDNYFDWGRGRDGTGYCYEFYRDGEI
ncbi:MAG: hypothetical protein AAF202_05525, partial [Pseudomonadota bacterium]